MFTWQRNSSMEAFLQFFCNINFPRFSISKKFAKIETDFGQRSSEWVLEAVRFLLLLFFTFCSTENQTAAVNRDLQGFRLQMCFSSLSFRLNFRPHFAHSCACSPRCSFMWRWNDASFWNCLSEKIFGLFFCLKIHSFRQNFFVTNRIQRAKKFPAPIKF